MKKQALIITILLSNAALAQNLPNYISVNSPNVAPTVSSTSLTQPQNTLDMNQVSTLEQAAGQTDVVGTIKALQDRAIAADDPTVGLSEKDKADFLNSMNKVKQLQEASKQLQNQINGNQTMIQSPSLPVQQQQNTPIVKRVEKPALKDIYINNISGWNTSTIDEFTKQGKDDLEKRYSEFLDQ